MIVRVLSSRPALLCFSCLFAVISLEFASSLVYQSFYGTSFPQEQVRARLDTDLSLRKSAQEGPAIPMPVRRKNLHPYFGFTLSSTQANSYGFPGPEPYMKKAEDEVVIAIMGGSVALHFARFQLVSDILRNVFPDKKVKFLALAIPGYKQPQQLIVFNYMLMSGAKFDIILNLDGFNEVALPYAENLAHETHPSFPRFWNFHSQRSLNQDLALLSGGILYKKERQQNINTLLTRGMLKRSAFFKTLARGIDNKLQRQINEMELEFSVSLGNSDDSKELLGPRVDYLTEADRWQDLAKIWRNSSLQMHQLASANSILYLHFLQPNQWVEGSKPFSSEELNLMSNNHTAGYRVAVEKAYPLLVENGERLLEQGVAFFDLTMAFKEEKQTLYYDACCHFNDIGNEIIANKIAEAIVLHQK